MVGVGSNCEDKENIHQRGCTEQQASLAPAFEGQKLEDVQTTG
jgi:hypothetical protein